MLRGLAPRGATRLPAGCRSELAHRRIGPETVPAQGRHEPLWSGFVRRIGRLLTPLGSITDTSGPHTVEPDPSSPYTLAQPDNYVDGPDGLADIVDTATVESAEPSTRRR